MSIYKGDKLVAGQGYDIDLIRGLHDPDWSQVVSITADQLSAGYTAPGRGMVVGYVNTDLTSFATVDVSINDIVVARAYRSGDGNPSMTTISANVCKGDIIKSNSALISEANISFVPYKAQ